MSKAAFTESPYLRICAKKYGYAYKKYAYTYEILLLMVCFILPFTEHAYTVYACLFPYAFFLRLTKNKKRTRYAYFSGIYKEFFCGVTSQGCLV